MAPPHAFDPHTFLAKVGAGRTLVAYQEQRQTFTQGDTADAVFYDLHVHSALLNVVLHD
jgi:hypothetical protein